MMRDEERNSISKVVTAAGFTLFLALLVLFADPANNTREKRNGDRAEGERRVEKGDSIVQTATGVTKTPSSPAAGENGIVLTARSRSTFKENTTPPDQHSEDNLLSVPAARPQDQPASLPAPLEKFRSTTIVEVGTNVEGDYVSMAKKMNSSYVGVEPIEYVKSRRYAESELGEENAVVVPLAVDLNPRNTTMSMPIDNEGKLVSVCSSLMKPCNFKAEGFKSKSGFKVRVETLQWVLEKYVPIEEDIYLLQLDMESVDLRGAASLFSDLRQRKRIANFMLECQDLPQNDEHLMGGNGSVTCAEAKACLRDFWPEFLFSGCYQNFWFAQRVCVWFNKKHKLSDPKIRPSEYEKLHIRATKYRWKKRSMWGRPFPVDSPPVACPAYFAKSQPKP